MVRGHSGTPTALAHWRVGAAGPKYGLEHATTLHLLMEEQTVPEKQMSPSPATKAHALVSFS